MRQFSYVRPSSLLLIPLLVAGLVLPGCDSTGSSTDDGSDDTEDIEVPSAYSFNSRFQESESAIAYPGQVTRNLLIADLKFQTDALGSSGASPVSNLSARYTESSETLDDLEILTADQIGFDPLDSQENYGDIATGKTLQGKATSDYADDVELIGSDDLPITGDSEVTADQLITSYLDRMQSNSDTDQLGSAAVYTTDEGVNMSQVVNKLLLGAVVYSQGTAKYLSTDLLSDSGNDGPRQEGETFSELGHIWDEAYGYFGAPRNFEGFLDYSSDNGLTSLYRDVNDDGAIDFSSEFTFTYASYAAERSAAASQDVDFARDAFEAFVAGRTDIINGAPVQDILEHRDAAREAWEKVVAVNVVHYLNSTKGDISGLSGSDTIQRSNVEAGELNEHWAEAKVFAWVLQYNPEKQISESDLESLHERLGATPPYGETKSDVVSDLDAARDILQSAYGFSDANMSVW